MDLEFDEDQLALRSTVRDLFADARRQGTSGPELMQAAGRIGLIGAAIPEDLGGAGLTTIEAMSVHELAGGALVRDPLLSNDLSAVLLARQASDKQRADLLPGIIEGTTAVVPALGDDAFAAGDLSAPQTRVVAFGDSFRVTGSKAMVLDAPLASAFLVPATDDCGQVGIYLVDAAADGTELSAYDLVDGRLGGDVTFTDAVGARIGGSDAGKVLDEVTDLWLLALTSQLLGVAGAALAMTCEYVMVREQFGQSIGRFQVVQHKVANMMIEVEQGRSMLLYGLSRFDRSPRERRAAMRLTKAKVSGSAQKVAESAVQLHGGLGITQEHEIGRYLQRVLVDRVLLGSPAQHFHARSTDYLVERAVARSTDHSPPSSARP